MSSYSKSYHLGLKQLPGFESVETSNDLISSMPALVTDNILKHLPISIAAKTSTLSRTWRSMWLSCQYLSFDAAFWEGFCKLDDGRFDWGIGSRIISNVLFHHTGGIHSFHLVLSPASAELLVGKHVSLSQWLSFISRTCPRKIVLLNSAKEWCNLVVMPSYIFHCTELTELKLKCFVLNAPPFDFKGFRHLKILELRYMKFNHDINMLWNWVAKCPCLVSLTVDYCRGVGITDANTPGIENISLKGTFDSLHLKKAPRPPLIDVSLSVWLQQSDLRAIKTVVATVKTLASSHGLQFLEIKGYLCKLLGEDWINKSIPVAFNKLGRLCLSDLALSDSDVFRFTLGIVQSCPFVTELEISIKPATDDVLHTFDYSSDTYKLERLHKVKITGITGKRAELKLVEYVLAISVVLDNLFFKFAKLDAVSELKVLRQLIRFPRASTKAQLVWLENRGGIGLGRYGLKPKVKK